MDRARLHRWLQPVDLQVVFNETWAPYASNFVLARYYQPILERIAYIALLCYWMFSTAGSGYLRILIEILVELFRSNSSLGGGENAFGRHWTISIAEIVLVSLFSRTFNYSFPDRY